MPHVPGRPAEGHDYEADRFKNLYGQPITNQLVSGLKPTAQSVLTSPNDLDLGMQEFLASLGAHPDPNYVPPSQATVQGIKQDWITNQYPPGTGVNPATDGAWRALVGTQQRSFLPGASDLTTSIYGPGDFGTPPPSPTIQGATQTANQYLMENPQGARSIVERLFPAGFNPEGVVREYEAGQAAIAAEYYDQPRLVQAGTGIIAGGFDPVTGDPIRLGSPVSMQASYDTAMAGDGNNAINFYEDLLTVGDPAAAEDFRVAYREENGVDPANLSIAVAAQGDGGPRQSDYYDNLDPGTQVIYDEYAALHPDQDTASLTKDFQALNAFLDTLPSEEERVEANKAKVTQADVDAYLKELDAMPDEDYNQIAKNLGLSSAAYRTPATTADKQFAGKKGVSDTTTKTSVGAGGAAADTLFGADMDRIVAEVARRDVEEPGWRDETIETSGGRTQETVTLTEYDWQTDFDAAMAAVLADPEVAAAIEEAEAAGVSPDGSPEGGDPDGDPKPFACPEGQVDAGFGVCVNKNITVTTTSGGGGDPPGGDDGGDPDIEGVFGNLTTAHQDAEIRRRMEEMGTTDLSQLIRDEFATITTPDYAADILTAHEGYRTAVRDAATARSEQLEASTTRAEGRIADIKSTLTGELAAFEVGRVEQQTALNQKVIDRTTDMELALTERLADIRTELGEQVTDEFESVAALAGTLVSSQATSSRDAMNRLGQIANMAAAARQAAPVELSGEALTALSDLEFQIESEIEQSKADTLAQINMEEASALLQETMRQGGFETTKQQAMVEATLGEKLRGTVYEDRIQEMMTEALLQEDQYVRQFGENVDMAKAQAQLQNLFGTQDYQRQLDMMNLTRTWQTADTIQSREWQTADVSQGREWQVSDQELLREQFEADQTTARVQQLADQGLARQQQLSDQRTMRAWQDSDYLRGLSDQRADYVTTLADQRADELRRRGWQTQDIDEANLWQLAMATQDRDWELADALAEGAVGTTPLDQLKYAFPDQDPGLYATAMQIGKMSNLRESASSWQDHPPDDPDFDGTVEKIGERYFVTEYGGLSEAEAYLRSLGEGTLIGQPDKWGSQPQRTPALSAEDYGALRALSDIARVLIQAEDDALYEGSGAQYDYVGGSFDPFKDYDAYLSSQ